MRDENVRRVRRGPARIFATGWEWISGDPLTRHWALVLGSNAARLSLGFVASVLIARALGPSEFGVYAVLGAVVAIAGAVADLGLTDAAVRGIAAVETRYPERARARGQVYFWLRLGGATLLVAFGALLATPLSRHVLALPGREGLLLLALAGVIATTLSGAVGGILQATRHFERFSALFVLNSALTVLLAVGLSAAGQLTLITALLMLGIGTSIISFAVALRLLPQGWSLRLPPWRVLVAEGSYLLRFGQWVWVANLFDMLTARLDLLLVNLWIPLPTVGAYALALNLASRVEVVNHSLYTVVLPAASALHGSGSLRHYIRRGLLRSVLIDLALLPLFFLAKPFILLFYGPAYALASGLFQLLLGVVMFDVLTTPLLLLVFPLNRPRLLAVANASRAATLILSAAWLIPGYGPVGAIVAKFGAKLVGAVLTLAPLAWQRSQEAP